MSLRHACSTALQATFQHVYPIRSFVTASRAELISRSTAGRYARSQPWSTSLRTYSATPREPDAFDALEDSHVTQIQDAAASEPATTQSSDSTTASLPWYLQQSVSPAPSSPITRQPLPDLPENPPPLLSDIMTHLSIDLGMDDISLLDLRQLDPPAALGANLIMLLCTARSEKHLHVSADRLCRWLRSTHALRPFADGLLGRNELKLMAKRKAKRARLLSSVGAKAKEGDDGMRTGWVCVNLGLIPGGVLPGPEPAADFVGFRTEESGTRVVVQMLTDEKRGALDLESLWTGIMNRSLRAAGEEELPKPKRDPNNPFPEATLITK